MKVNSVKHLRLIYFMFCLSWCFCFLVSKEFDVLHFVRKCVYLTDMFYVSMEIHSRVLYRAQKNCFFLVQQAKHFCFCLHTSFFFSYRSPFFAFSPFTPLFSFLSVSVIFFHPSFLGNWSILANLAKVAPLSPY